MAVEVELKLIADPSFVESELLEALAKCATLGEPREVHQRDTYLDDAAAGLAAAGLAARTRDRGDHVAIEVKPVPIDPQLMMKRAELTAEVKPGRDPGQVLRRLVDREFGLELSGQLAPAVVLETQRRIWDLHTAELGAELCVDRVRVQGQEDGSFVEVELELTRGDERALARLGEILRAVSGLGRSRKSKYLRARQALGLPGYRYAVPGPDFAADARASSAICSSCLSLWRTVRAYEPGTRVGLDTEQLHKMRVATRRLRTALRVFADQWTAEEHAALRGPMRRLGRRLGAVRDLDVLQLGIPNWKRQYGEQPPAGWDALAHALARRHKRARKRLLEVLDGPVYKSLDDVANSVFATVKDDESDSIAKIGAAGLRSCLEAFENAIRVAHADPTPQAAHQLRIDAKQLRYTLELLRPIMSSEAHAPLASLRAFQDSLGALQDDIVAGGVARVLRHKTRTRVGSTLEGAFVLGQLSGAAARASLAIVREIEPALTELGGDRFTAAIASEIARLESI